MKEPSSQKQSFRQKMQGSIAHLQAKKKVLFLTTSNRWAGEEGGEMPKSTRLAHAMAERIGPEKVAILDVAKLNIAPCEGNVSTARGNTCGLREAKLDDPQKNPSGHHRCWASLNHPDDELWKVSQALLESEAVVFFASVRWGQANAHYQKLIERLTWLENRHSTLGESNLLQNIEAGLILVGQNWRGPQVLQAQKEVLGFFGFRLPEALWWNWQYSQDSGEESDDSYKQAAVDFEEILNSF